MSAGAWRGRRPAGADAGRIATANPAGSPRGKSPAVFITSPSAILPRGRVPFKNRREPGPQTGAPPPQAVRSVSGVTSAMVGTTTWAVPSRLAA